MNLFATHPLGFSDLVEQELLGCGAQITARTTAGIAFSGIARMRVSRVSVEPRRESDPAADRYVRRAGTGCAVLRHQRTNWLDHLEPDCSIAVDFTTTHSQINHSLYGAQRVKDAIVDQMRDATGVRPNVDIQSPDVRINVHLERDRASVSIDLSGESLHRRGYRAVAGPAPLKENLAAALLLRARLAADRSRRRRAARSDVRLRYVCDRSAADRRRYRAEPARVRASASNAGKVINRTCGRPLLDAGATAPRGGSAARTESSARAITTRARSRRRCATSPLPA